jgi:hypothetical protein
MSTLNHLLVLNTLVKHETLTLTDISKKENLGLIPNKHHLQLLLDRLEHGLFIQKLSGAAICTYTVTDKGIAESERLKSV